jgi:transportin-3
VQEDKIQVYEAIAHVISAMPMEQAAQSLKTFAADILALVHNITVRPQPAMPQELSEVCGKHESAGKLRFVLITWQMLLRT